MGLLEKRLLALYEGVRQKKSLSKIARELRVSDKVLQEYHERANAHMARAIANGTSKEVAGQLGVSPIVVDLYMRAYSLSEDLPLPERIKGLLLSGVSDPRAMAKILGVSVGHVFNTCSQERISLTKARHANAGITESERHKTKNHRTSTYEMMRASVERGNATAQEISKDIKRTYKHHIGAAAIMRHASRAGIDKTLSVGKPGRKMPADLEELDAFLFGQFGEGNFTVKDIAEDIGINEANIYVWCKAQGTTFADQLEFYRAIESYRGEKQTQPTTQAELSHRKSRGVSQERSVTKPVIEKKSRYELMREAYAKGNKTAEDVAQYVTNNSDTTMTARAARIHASRAGINIEDTVKTNPKRAYTKRSGKNEPTPEDAPDKDYRSGGIETAVTYRRPIDNNPAPAIFKAGRADARAPAKFNVEKARSLYETGRVSTHDLAALTGSSVEEMQTFIPPAEDDDLRIIGKFGKTDLTWSLAAAIYKLSAEGQGMTDIVKELGVSVDAAYQVTDHRRSMYHPVLMNWVQALNNTDMKTPFHPNMTMPDPKKPSTAMTQLKQHGLKGLI